MKLLLNRIAAALAVLMPKPRKPQPERQPVRDIDAARDECVQEAMATPGPRRPQTHGRRRPNRPPRDGRKFHRIFHANIYPTTGANIRRAALNRPAW